MTKEDAVNEYNLVLQLARTAKEKLQLAETEVNSCRITYEALQKQLDSLELQLKYNY